MITSLIFLMSAFVGIEYGMPLVPLKTTSIAAVPTFSPPKTDSALPPYTIKDGVLQLGLPVTVIKSTMVRQQLDLGLTISFVIEVNGSAGLKGIARVDLRFEPWDEVYFVTVFHFNAKPKVFTLASLDALTSWFESAPIRMASLSQPPRGMKLKVSARFLPFSRGDQDKTRVWFSQSLSGDTSDVSGVADFLLTNSIKRQSISTFRWKLELKP